VGRSKLKGNVTAFLSGSLIMLLMLSSIACGMPGDPMQDDMYTRDVYPGESSVYDVGSDSLRYAEGFYDRVRVYEVLNVGGTPALVSPDTRKGAGYFDSSLRIRSEENGFGIAVIEHDASTPLHSGTGSFDLTGGAYESLFTSTTPVFAIEDFEKSNLVVLTSGDYWGYISEVTTYIDAFNVVVTTAGWSGDITAASFIVVEHPVFATAGTGYTHIDAKTAGGFAVHSYDYTGECLVAFELDVAADDLSGLCVEVDANGYSDVEALRVRYASGDLQPLDLNAILKVSLDDTGATSSDATTEIDFISLLTLDEEDVSKHAIHVGQGFDSALTVSGGVEEDPDYGYEVSPDVPIDRVTGVAPDGTAFLDASGSDLIIFDADNDYVLIGSDALFEAISAVLTNGANQPIIEEYYYSTGAGTWATLIVSDTVNGFTQSGTIAFNAPAAWAKSNLTVPAGAAITNAYYIKIVRTRNYLGAPPVESYFKTFTSSSTTDFEVRGDGTLRPVEMADAAASNNSLYYSTTQNKLVYKDSGGVVRDLW